MRQFWISWYQSTEDIRPVTYPPNAAVLGWWCSGTRCSDEAATMCAMVRGVSEQHAKQNIICDWPEASEWRFCEEVDLGTLPGDRFPVKSYWSKERFNVQF